MWGGRFGPIVAPSSIKSSCRSQKKSSWAKKPQNCTYSTILPWSIWPKAIWFTFKYSILGVSIRQYQPWVMGISASADSWHSNTHQHQPSLAKRGVADKNLVQWHLSFLNPDSHSPITSWPALPQLAPISWSVFPIPLPHFHLIWPQYFHLIWPGHASNMFWVMACAPHSHTSPRERRLAFTFCVKDRLFDLFKLAFQWQSRNTCRSRAFLGRKCGKMQWLVSLVLKL